MSGILGLTSGKTFEDKGFYSLNDRRMVFHEYPNGAAPLTGLLSLMNTEPTDNSKFGWWEKRFVTPKTTIAPGGLGPFSTAGGDVAFATPKSFAVGEAVRALVVSTADFRVRDQIWFKDLPTSAGVGQLQGIVTAIISATKLEFQVVEAVANVLNNQLLISAGTGPIGANVVSLGTVNAENAASNGYGIWFPPINPENYTQIFRTPFGFSGTSLKIPANFDKTGLYKEKAKDSSILHMTGLEKAFIFGQRSLQNVNDPQSGDLVPMRTTGGIYWYLQQWEMAEGGIYGYRPGGLALTADADDEKRIIRNTSGTMTWATFNSYIERAFRRTNNKSFEKIVFCGSRALGALNTLIENKVVTNKNLPAESTYGMNLVTIETTYGTLHFKSHPLFTEHPAFAYSMLIVDVGNLVYRPLNDRDTVLLADRQANDVDGRKDEWFSECGLEVRFPESNMLIQNVQQITVA